MKRAFIWGNGPLPLGAKKLFIQVNLWVEPTGKKVEIRYMDFWKVVDGKIVDNWVMVDFPHVLAQLGVDVFNGEGWEAFDRGGAQKHHIKPLKQR